MVPGFTRQKIQKLLTLIDTPKASENLMGEPPWLIDSGASTDMTGNAKFLKDVAAIQHVEIYLPDGARTVATKQGSAVMDNYV